MILLAQFDRPTLFVLVALGLSIAILMMRAHRYLSRQRGDDRALVVPQRPKSEPATRLMDGPPELAKWEIEMHETARDLSAELNSRISALRAMVAEADRAAARLEAALERASGARPGDSGDGPSNPAPGSFAPRDKVSSEAVYELADYGFPAAEIAARLGRPLAEIERILRERT